MENKAQDKKEDKLILGGYEFNSRFILGSGKYNVNLIKAAVEQGGEISCKSGYKIKLEVK